MGKLLLKDKNIFESIKGLMIIDGRHLTSFIPKYAHPHGKVYSWRVHGETHHLDHAEPGHIATVWDAQGKSPIIITRVYTVTGSAAIKIAKHRLKPVMNCWKTRLK